MSNFQNPCGALMPDGNKRELVELLNKHDIPIIEDDVYAELFFGRHRPKPLNAFDRKGLVLNSAPTSVLILSRQVSEHIHHGVHPADVNARVVVAAALAFREMKAMTGVEIAGAGATQMNRCRQVLLL